VQHAEVEQYLAWKEREMAPFTEDNLQRIMINPFYALTVASQLTEEHEPPMSEEEWVQANVLLIRDRGAEAWLRQLVDVLEGKATPADEYVSPYQAITIDPLFATEHPPIIERAMWIEVNAMQIRSMGVQEWLRQLLDVLDGDIVTAQEVGFAPPGGPIGYDAPGRPHPQRWGKKKRKKRHHK